MSESDPSLCCYPNKMGRIILLALEEIIGRNGVNAVLHRAQLSDLINNYPPDNLDLGFRCEILSRTLVALESMYGVRGGRGVALRAGRACLKYGLREFAPMLGLTDMAFRLLPLNEKIRQGADAYARLFNRLAEDGSPQRVEIAEDEDHLIWLVESCPLCWGRQSDSPVCHLTVGLLQESLYWISGGKFFDVEEVECIACAAPACKILISKQPLE